MKHLPTSDGLRLAYIDTGTASKTTPVVFIHGYPVDHRMWSHQISALEPSHRLIAYDLRGFGKSPLGDLPATLETHVSDLFHVLDTLELRRVILVGLSMGGYIALRAIERQPERFDKLVLCDTQSVADGNEAKIKRHQALEKIKTQGPEVFARDFLMGALANEQPDHPESCFKDLFSAISGLPIKNLQAGLFSLMTRTDTTESLNKIHVPTLIFVGEADRITPASIATDLQQRIPNSMLSIVPNAGHFSPMENATFVNPILKEFIES